jgi:hypothetical protein
VSVNPYGTDPSSRTALRRTDFVNQRSPVAAITRSGANVGQRDSGQDTSTPITFKRRSWPAVQSGMWVNA